jgi:8-oxo-dGTP diphosphatase
VRRFPQPAGWLRRVSDHFRLVPAVYVALLRRISGAATSEAPVDEVLLQLRQGTGYMDGHWALGAAGHVEAGESVFQAAVREAAEELGVVLAPADIRPLCAMHRTAPTHDPIDERVDFFVVARVWAGTPRLLEPDKAADLRWCRLDRLDQLPEPVVPHERTVLDGLRAGRLEPIVTFGF